MKKTLLKLLFFFSISMAFSQNSCTNALTVLLNSTTTAPAYTNETGVAPTLICSLPGGVGTKGKWYTFTATSNETITITTVLPQNNNTDTRVIVYTGDCSNLSCVISNDDYNGNYGSYVTFQITTGTVYTIAFDNRYSNLGFDFNISVAPPPLPDRLSFTQTAVAGITGGYNNCVVDMNGDYLDDIVSAVSTTQLAITYQNPNHTFNTNTFTTPNSIVLPSWSIAAGDYDNNGYNDLLYGSGSGVVFLKANYNGTAYTVDRKPEGYLVQRTNFVDINNDGFLDGFACDDNSPNRYYYNDTNGNLTSQTTGGIGSFPSGGNYASNWFDYDNDGDLDMHLSKCGQGGSGVGGNIDEMYRNNGNGTYTNVAVAANLADPEQTWSSAIGDFNNDGWMDIIVGVNATTNGGTNVKRNNGDGTFTSVTTGSGFDTFVGVGREYVAADFDNDGFLDVLGSAGNILFGDGNFHFTPNPNAYPISLYDRPIGDLNNDGFLDIQSGTNVFINNGNTNNWFNVNLHGIQSNHNGIGARIEIYGAWGKQIRDVQSGTGFRNMSTLTAHFGIGAETEITQLIIRWPSGVVDSIDNPSSNQSILIIEGSTLGVNNYAANTAFSLYPIPSKNILNVKLNDNISIASATVFNLLGKQVLNTKLNNDTINIELLSNGTYILLLKDDNGKEYSQKFIKE